MFSTQLGFCVLIVDKYFELLSVGFRLWVWVLNRMVLDCLVCISTLQLFNCCGVLFKARFSLKSVFQFSVSEGINGCYDVIAVLYLIPPLSS
jgi:hypothetical protein